MNNDIIIKTENLEYIYQKGMPFETAALKNVNLCIRKGTFNAIIGHTGSGKSTLIQHFNALIKPTGGKIYIDGEDIQNTDLKKLRAKVGLVFQYPEYQLFEETVYKDIAFGPSNMGLSASEIKERVLWSLSLTGLSQDILDMSPFELSGGQKRRAAIAGVLAMHPSVLILDEPAAGLDPAGSREIMRGIRSLYANVPDMTVIFVSHSMEDVAAIADNIIVMNEGTAAMVGTADEIFSRADELNKMKLDIPQLTLIANILRSHGVDIPDGLYTPQDMADALCKIIRKEPL